MWYAIAPDLSVELPTPVPVVRVVLPPAVTRPPAPVVRHPFPAIFYWNVTLPAKYETSERGAIRYICHELHIQFRFSGPDYALYGAGVPFNRKMPAITLLRDLANVSYIGKQSFTLQSRQVAVRNIWLPGMAR